MNVQDLLADRGSIKADFAALRLGKGDICKRSRKPRRELVLGTS